MNASTYNDFRKGGFVSIWIGNFKSDIELDDYLNLSREFENDFGFEINEKDMPEISIESQSTPIKKLVDGFSWSGSYSNGVANFAKKLGVDSATTMIVFLNFAYAPDKAKPRTNAPLQFLGVFAFS